MGRVGRFSVHCLIIQRIKFIPPTMISWHKRLAYSLCRLGMGATKRDAAHSTAQNRTAMRIPTSFGAMISFVPNRSSVAIIWTESHSSAYDSLSLATAGNTTAIS